MMYAKSLTAWAAGISVLLIPLVGARVIRERSTPMPTIPPRLQTRTASACQGLYKSFPELTFFPNSTQYFTETHHIWSETCVLEPNCVFEPTSAKELSSGMLLIKEAKSKFAVRSGGHMPVPGAQSVDDGVMISMSGLAQKTLNSNNTIASIGPGNQWIDVYNYLAQFGLAVNGGRFPSVGVGGVLVGGGIGYFSGRYGWSCDNVVSYEVVLSDGRIVEATSTNNFSDLYWALKGGHNHFGIVTSFDVRTFPMTAAFGGVATWTGLEAGDAYYDALTAYMAPGGGVDDPDSHINSFVGVVPANGSSSITYSNLMLYPGSNPSPPALVNFTNLLGSEWESSVQSSGIAAQPNWIDISQQLASFGTDNQRDLFVTFGYIATPDAIRFHNATVIEGALQKLKHVEALTIYASHQPISKDYMEASRKLVPGGNVLGLDPKVDGTFLVGRIDAIWENAKDDEDVYNFAQESVNILKNEFESQGLWTGFTYLNDAAYFQAPFDSYAGGKNLPRLYEIRAKYDPDHFLKDYLQHGFALE